MARRPRKRSRTDWPSRLIQAGFVIALVALWYLAATRWGVNRLLLPNPVLVYDNLVDILWSGEFIDDLVTTLGELASAFALAATFGVALG
jgi:ABC-type nitrate/sulfonate/bicarbonate transport system permease component